MGKVHHVGCAHQAGQQERDEHSQQVIEVSRSQEKASGDASQEEGECDKVTSAVYPVLLLLVFDHEIVWFCCTHFFIPPLLLD
jgi:hypothetical protein